MVPCFGACLTLPVYTISCLVSHMSNAGIPGGLGLVMYSKSYITGKGFRKPELTVRGNAESQLRRRSERKDRV